MALSNAEIEAIMDQFDAGEYDLETALNEIATMQKGEDVRKAIYAGIMLANNSGSGNVDLYCRRRQVQYENLLNGNLEAVIKQMSNFITNNSGTIEATKITETTLFSSNTPNKGDTITVEDDPNNYNYLDVRYAAFGRTGIVRLTPADLAAGAHWSEFENITAASVSTGATAVRKIAFVLQRSDSSTLSQSINVWRWTGEATDVGALAQTIGQTWSVGIYSITGIKYVTVSNSAKDTELTDIRVGYDGTEYESAGAAVRGQITSVVEMINEINLNVEDLLTRVSVLEGIPSEDAGQETSN